MKHKGFTIIELIVVIAVVGILAGLTTFGYRMWRQDLTEKIVMNDLNQAGTALENYRNFKNYFPPNLAGANFAASEGVGLALYTNAPSVGIYNNLDDQSNAQLLLNTCNANIYSTNNTACVFNGNGAGAKIHVKGTNASNTHWRSPIHESDIVLPTSMNNEAQRIITQSKAQGGKFPVIITNSKNVTLPETTQVPNGPATRYCLEGRAADYDVIYHITDKDSSIKSGTCPNDPTLKYYP